MRSHNTNWNFECTYNMLSGGNLNKHSPRGGLLKDRNDDWDAIISLRDEIIKSREQMNQSPELNLQEELTAARKRIEFLEWQNQELQQIVNQLREEK